MDIQLNNIKCHENSKFSFPDQGLVLLKGTSGIGKCLAPGTGLLLSDNTKILVENVKVNDKLMGPDGQPRNVLSICSGTDNMFKVIPSDGGTPYTVNSQHILTLINYQAKIYENGSAYSVIWAEPDGFRSVSFSTLQDAKIYVRSHPLQTMFNIPIKDYLKMNHTLKRQFYGCHIGVNFTHIDTGIDPYVLGYLFGGFSNSTRRLSEQKKFLLREFVDNFRPENYSHILPAILLNKIVIAKNLYEITGIFDKIFFTLNTMVGNYINIELPPSIVNNSFIFRSKFIEGLIDSGGVVRKRIMRKNLFTCMADSYVYISSPLLTKSIVKIIESLGYIIEVKSHNKYGEGTVNKIIIKNYTTNWDDVFISYCPIKVVPQQTGKYYGFTIDQDNLFLLSDYTITHNSSIFEGINFALYGSGKRNLVRHGEKKCAVSMNIGEMKITRQKGPNKLTLIDRDGAEYTNDSAQEIINQIYGTEFTITSYVSQLNKDSFLYLSPADRMGFLEKIAIGAFDVSKIKDKCKNAIKTRKELLSNKTGSLQAIQNEFNTMKEPEAVKFPLSEPYSDKKVEKQRTKHKDLNQIVEESKRKLALLHKEYSSHKLYLQKRDRIVADIDTNQSKADELSEQIEDIEIPDIKSLEDRIEILKTNNELTTLKTILSSDNKNYEALMVVEKHQTESMLDELKKIKIIPDRTQELTTNIKNYNELKQLRNKLSQCIKDIEELDTLENYTTALDESREEEAKLTKELIESEKVKKIHICPKCSCSINIINGELAIADDIPTKTRPNKQIQSDLKEVRDNIWSYIESKQELTTLLAKKTKQEARISELSQIDENINHEEELINHTNKLREQKERIKNMDSLEYKLSKNEYSHTINTIKSKIDKMTKEIAEKEQFIKKSSNNLTETNIDKLTDMLYKYKLLAQKKELFTKQLKDTNKILDTLRTELQSLSKPTTEVDYEKEISSLEQNITTHEETQAKYNRIEKKLNLYLDYKTKQDTYDKWKSKVEAAKEEERIVKTSLSVAEKLYRKIQESESASVIETIESINTHMKYYLDKFFTDPIEVNILSFKETAKDTKPQINISCGYKGNECDISSLSGGERARIEMSICLAINSLIGSNILLFDESLGPLDQDTTEIILEVLKTEAKENKKLIITILHNATEGLFDRVVSLDSE